MSNINYYITGNTAEGFVNLLESNIKNVAQIIVLNHPSEAFKTNIINNFIKSYEADENVEILCSALGSKYLDGVIFRKKSVAILSNKIIIEKEKGTISIDFEHNLPNMDEERSQFNKYTQEAYNNFKTGLQIHDDLEDIYINEMNFDRADQFTHEFINNLLTASSKVRGKTGNTFHRLFGTNTSEGIVNVVPQLLKTVSNSHFIKGRAGTGKSTFMKKIAKACTEHGLDVELYHCSFDPNSIDMVLVRDLDFCIFDSTDPHEFFPDRNGDVIVDLYEELVTPGTDEKYEKEITELNNYYKSFMRKGIESLKTAGEYIDTIEQKYENEVSKEDLDAALAGIKMLIQ